MNTVVIVGALRTPLGAFMGGLSSLTAPQLGAKVIKALLERCKLSADEIDEVYMGQVLTAGVGQAPARQAAIYARLPESVPCTTVNKVCGSGMKAIILAMQSLALGDNEVVIAGGMESMSQAPYLLPQARQGYSMGHQKLVDSMIFDGLWDPYNNQHMGNCGELCATKYGLHRELQDHYAIRSYQRALEAQEKGYFRNELVSIEVVGKKGKTTLFDTDESPLQVNFEKVPSLKPVFDPKGTITAANASSINDGAAALILMTEKKARELNMKPLATITGYAQHAQSPEWFTTAPVEAIKKCAGKASWNLSDIDLFEINEAFSVVPLVVQKELNIPDNKLNIWGGAVSLGHPIGASGCRIVVTLISALHQTQKHRGLASLCIGGGEGIAIAIECERK